MSRARLLPMLLLLLGVAPLAAQRPHRRGFWLEFGGGPATARVACAGCSSVTTATGSSGYLRLGGTVSRGVLLGVELASFSDERFGFHTDPDRRVKAETASLGILALWYPWRGGFFLKGGVGLAGGDFTVRPDSGQRRTVNGNGVGMNFGVGYDLNLSGRLALTATAAASIAAIGDLVLPTVTIDDAIASVYHLNLGLTFR